MNIPPKYEDVVAKLFEARCEIVRLESEAITAGGREAALREELAAMTTIRDYCNRVALHNKEVGDDLQQRLTVAERRAGELHKWVVKYRNVVATRRYGDNDEGEMHQRADRIEISRLDVALKPFAEGEGS